jgi:hypothetical protein
LIDRNVCAVAKAKHHSADDRAVVGTSANSSPAPPRRTEEITTMRSRLPVRAAWRLNSWYVGLPGTLRR